MSEEPTSFQSQAGLQPQAPLKARAAGQHVLPIPTADIQQASAAADPLASHSQLKEGASPVTDASCHEPMHGPRLAVALSEAAAPTAEASESALCIRPVEMLLDSRPAPQSLSNRLNTEDRAANAQSNGQLTQGVQHGPQQGNGPDKEMWDILRQVLHLAEIAIQVTVFPISGSVLFACTCTPTYSDHQ